MDYIDLSFRVFRNDITTRAKNVSANQSEPMFLYEQIQKNGKEFAYLLF